jgi:hypothetical integral membrane protein (TIGR02206 family)
MIAAHRTRAPQIEQEQPTMDRFFAKDWTGAPFELFNTPHLIALSIVLLINVALLRWGRRFPERWRRPTRYALAGLLVVDELLWHWWNASIGEWTIQKMLPLHLCSVFVWLNAAMLIWKVYSIYEVAYLLGIAGALQALLTPDAGQYGFPHFRAFQVMVSHGAIITSAIYMTAVEGFRPRLKSILRVLAVANVYMLAVFFLNLAIGSNYLFIAHKPETASLLDVLPPWPWYILYIEAIGWVMVGLLYLPFLIHDLRARGATSASQQPAT